MPFHGQCGLADVLALAAFCFYFFDLLYYCGDVRYDPVLFTGGHHDVPSYTHFCV